MNENTSLATAKKLLLTTIFIAFGSFIIGRMLINTSLYSVGETLIFISNVLIFVVPFLWLNMLSYIFKAFFKNDIIKFKDYMIKFLLVSLSFIMFFLMAIEFYVNLYI